MLRHIARRIERLERRRLVSVPTHPLDPKVRFEDFEGILDPIEFSRLAFGHDHWGLQAKILESIAKNRRTAVKACHSSGKTFCAADAVLWWITTHPDGIAVTTAPTWMQVKRLLWGEIRKSVAVSTIRYPTPLKTRLDLGPNRYALGLSTNEGVRFQGWHGKILVVIDEAPGVRPEIYEAIEGIRAGGDVRVLALGNPIIASGPFYDAFSVNRDGWSLFTIGEPCVRTKGYEHITLGPGEPVISLPHQTLHTVGVTEGCGSRTTLVAVRRRLESVDLQTLQLDPFQHI